MRFIREIHGYDGTDRRGVTWNEPLKKLFSTMRPLVEGAERIVIAPESATHLIPWAAVGEAVGWNDMATGPLAFVTIPTIPGMARAQRRPKTARRGAAVIGNPLGDLEAAQAEAVAIARGARH